LRSKSNGSLFGGKKGEVEVCDATWMKKELMLGKKNKN
jgi:hypothetical protein